MSENTVAVIGMAGRFPGASNVDALWQALLDGRNLTRALDRSALAGTAHAPYLDDPNYVFRCAVLDDPALFDAGAFGMTPAEAMMTDPQQRLFLSCCREALEQSGHPSPERQGLRSGVYGGCSISTYLLNNLLRSPDFRERDPLQLAIGSDKDFMVSRVSYKLDLRGPAVAVQTACSTSLVAIHQACQALLNGEADLALAGGATVSAFGALGYLYTPEGIRSPDGFCRPFDANAAGTIFGDGVGVVVLRRLDDALADGDYIYAVVRGSAVNNDGNDKAGYTAPSVNGQRSVIAEALEVAEVSADEIAFIEAHGTATLLGDPVEVRALTQAFDTPRKNYCALGSIKSNVGHLDAASGVIGFIKAALALRHRTLPASLNFSSPNPALDLDRSPFFICSETLALHPLGELHAGVSSFGIGGTNAHVVLSSPPLQFPQRSEPPASPHLYLWSARSEQGLESLLTESGRALDAMPGLNAVDVAHTLARGRTIHRHRAIVVDETLPGSATVAQALRHKVSEKKKKLVFLYPGQGSRWVGVAEPLYRSDEAFRGHVDRLCDMLVPLLGEDLRRWLFPVSQDQVEAEEKDRHTQWAQPAFFVLCRALSEVLREHGLNADVVMGHSLGELLAACEAGGMSEVQTASLVVRRGRLMEQSPEGAMLAVLGDREELRKLPDDLLNTVDVAAYNSPRQTVLAGETEAIRSVARILRTRNVSCRPLGVTRAFHSRLMDAVVQAWRKEVSTAACSPLRIPLVSNLSGTIRQAGETLGVDHWIHHLRQPVAFMDSVRNVLSETEHQGSEAVFIEVGTGNALGMLVKTIAPCATVVTLAGANGRLDRKSLLTSLGHLWMIGCPPDVATILARGQTVPLPVSPLDPKRHWIAPPEEESRPHDRVLLSTGDKSPEMASAEALIQQLVKIWRQTLQISHVGAEDNFFALGGDSMQALEISRAAKRQGIPVSPRLIFDHPTIAQLARVVHADAATQGEKTDAQETEYVSVRLGLTNRKTVYSDARLKEEDLGAILAQLDNE